MTEGIASALRRAVDADAQSLIGLVGLCFAEYPGCFVDPRGDVPDLVRPAEFYVGPGETFLVAEDARGQICACIALAHPEPRIAEIHRLYVRADQRGQGLASRLIDVVERQARLHGAAAIQAWSDTRFHDAHRLYGRLGYARVGEAKPLGDISNSVEFLFVKALPEN